MSNIGANNKEWWTAERRKQHSLKVKSSYNRSRKPRVLPDNFSNSCREGQISYYEKKDQVIMKTLPFEEWPIRLIKKRLFLENGNKCQICNFEYTDPETGKGPFQIHHINGNKKNWKRKNLEIRCLNCHWMTPNFAFRGRRHSKETRKILAEKANNYYKKINDAG